MSSLAAARADNFYLSKNYNPLLVPPKKSQLEERKPFVHKQGQIVYGKTIRYQTPFNVRCKGCGNSIAKGVRFNAVQRYVGDYFTTQIWQFYMKCPHCPMRITSRTDPEHCDYLYTQGAYRIWQASDCTQQQRIRDQQKQQKISQDPFFKLENEFIDKQKNEQNLEIVQSLQKHQQRGLQDFELNRLLRKQIKKRKTQQKQYLQQKTKMNLSIPLVDLTQKDQQKVKQTVFKTKFIKKETPSDRRTQLKQKIAKLNPTFKRILKKQIQEKQKIPSIFSKKK